MFFDILHMHLSCNFSLRIASVFLIIGDYPNQCTLRLLPLYISYSLFDVIKIGFTKMVLYMLQMLDIYRACRRMWVLKCSKGYSDTVAEISRQEASFSTTNLKCGSEVWATYALKKAKATKMSSPGYWDFRSKFRFSFFPFSSATFVWDYYCLRDNIFARRFNYVFFPRCSGHLNNKVLPVSRLCQSMCLDFCYTVELK